MKSQKRPLVSENHPTEKSPLFAPFQQFVAERQYLINVSPKTISWYWDCYRALVSRLSEGTTLEALTPADIKAVITRMRMDGVSPISVNSFLTGLNTFFRSAGRGELVHPKLKTEKRVPPQYSDKHLEKLLNFHPRRLNDQRAVVLVAFIIDTGLRAEEALLMKRDQIDFENQIVRAFGKGRKERLLPISLELRGILFKWFQHAPKSAWVFPTQNGTPLAIRNAERDVDHLVVGLGLPKVRRTLHALRHTFATSYLRNGGDAFRLQKMLGHTTLTMTKEYVNLVTKDLSDVHEDLSPLRGRRKHLQAGRRLPR